MLVVVGEVSCQLLSRIKVSICRELASSLETKGRRPLIKGKGNCKECRYLMGTSGVDVVVANDDESKVLDGEQSGPRSGAEGQWLISLANRCDGELVRACGVVLIQDYEFGARRRYEARVEGGCVRRSFRRYESRVETAAVLPGGGGGGGGA